MGEEIATVAQLFSAILKILLILSIVFRFRWRRFTQGPREIILHAVENAIYEPAGIRAPKSLRQFDRFVD